MFAWWGFNSWAPAYLELPPDRGGIGRDTIIGGDGNDVMDGQANADIMLRQIESGNLRDRFDAFSREIVPELRRGSAAARRGPAATARC